jgi:hypothetical protein
MNEDYSVNENDHMIPEHQYYSEYNDSSLIGEHEQYAVEDSYVPSEFQSYDSGSSAQRLSRHSSVLRNNRNRLGRLLAMLAAIIGPAAIIILTALHSIFVDVRDYKAGAGTLDVTLHLYSSSDDTEFNAVLTDREGNVAGEAAVDRNVPVLQFDGLEPGGLYYLEVFADGKPKLKLNYILPKENEITPLPSDHTADPNGTGDPGATPTPPDGSGSPSTELPTEAPTAVPEPAVTLEGSEVTYNSLVLTLKAENIDPADLIVSIGNRKTVPVATDDSGRCTATLNNLSPDTEYDYTVTDKDGRELYSDTITTAKRTGVTIELASFTNDLTWANLEFNVTNPDGNTINTSLDGIACNYEKNGDTISFAFSDLEEGSNHVLDFYDWDGSRIMSHQFSTRARTPASVTVISETIGFDKATLSFSITNPDRNTIQVRYDGIATDPPAGDNYVLTRTGLVSGQTHTVEFIDQDGTVVFTRSFAARARTPATVSFTQTSPGFNSANVRLSVNNPDGNTLELRVNGNRFSADLSSASPSVTVTGLRPRTTYTLTVYDVSTGQNAASTSLTTATSLNWSQDGSGNATFTLTDEFKAAYQASSVSLSLKDGFGESVNVTSNGSGTFNASAYDIVFADTYTVTLTSGGSTADTVTASLTGKARPVFNMTYKGYGPATFSVAREYDMSSITYPELKYVLRSGYIEELDPNADDPDGDLDRRWTALVVSDSSGRSIGMQLTGFDSDSSLLEVGEECNIYFMQDDGLESITDGTYKAAFYTIDGYSFNEMEVLLWGDGNMQEPTSAEVYEVFKKGRRTSAEVSFNTANTSPRDDAYIFTNTAPTVDTASNTAVYYLTWSYYPLVDGQTEAFVAVVSASDTSTPLTLRHPDVDRNYPTRLSIGKNSAYSEHIDRLTVDTAGPVYIIVYTGSFDESNFLYVIYTDPQ